MWLNIGALSPGFKRNRMGGVGNIFADLAAGGSGWLVAEAGVAREGV